MPGTMGQQEVEDAEEGNFGDVGRLVDDDCNQEEDLLDKGFGFVYDVDGKVDGEIAFHAEYQLIHSAGVI